MQEYPQEITKKDKENDMRIFEPMFNGQTGTY